MEALDEIPGVGVRTIQEVIAEIGTDMSRFPTSAHISSWAKVCPGNNESRGKRKSASAGRGSPWLRTTLVEAAWSTTRTKDTYFAVLYRRIAARRGGKRALLAVAHSMLVIIYHMLRDGMPYRDLGGNYFDEYDRNNTVRRAVKRIEKLGYTVTLDAA